MMFIDVYRSAGNGYEMPSFVNFILKEDGTYINNILFPESAETTSHNPIFAFIFHTDSNDAWISRSMNYQVTICYDLRFLDVHADSREYNELVSIFEKIMQCKVMLMPFSSFERAIGLYTKLLDILIHQSNTQNTEFCGVFRRQTSSMVDMHLHLVLKCFLDNEKPVEDCMWQCEGGTAWCAFFEDSSRLYWYHDYVMHIINAAKRDGYSISNVEAATYDIRKAQSTKTTKEELNAMRAQESFLDLLKKAYKYRFQSF
jgi:hypothetical protein